MADPRETVKIKISMMREIVDMLDGLAKERETKYISGRQALTIVTAELRRAVDELEVFLK